MVVMGERRGAENASTTVVFLRSGSESIVELLCDLFSNLSDEEARPSRPTNRTGPGQNRRRGQFCRADTEIYARETVNRWRLSMCVLKATNHIQYTVHLGIRRTICTRGRLCVGVSGGISGRTQQNATKGVVLSLDPERKQKCQPDRTPIDSPPNGVS